MTPSSRTFSLPSRNCKSPGDMEGSLLGTMGKDNGIGISAETPTILLKGPRAGLEVGLPVFPLRRGQPQAPKEPMRSELMPLEALLGID